MGTKLSPPDEELYRRVDEVLHYIWDPIGISGFPMARDEYYLYLPHVFSLLKANVEAEPLTQLPGVNYLGRSASIILAGGSEA